MHVKIFGNPFIYVSLIFVHRLSSHLTQDENGSICSKDIIGNIRHLPGISVKDIHSQLDSIIKNKYNVSPKREADGTKHYYGLTFSDMHPLDETKALHNLQQAFPNSVMKIKCLPESQLSVGIVARDETYRSVLIDVKSKKISVTDNDGESLEKLCTVYSGDITFNNHVVDIIDSIKCSLRRSPSCLVTFSLRKHFKKKSHGHLCPRCADCKNKATYHLKKKTQQETTDKIYDDLEAVSPEFLTHVKSQMENAKKGRPTHPQR